MPLNIESGRGYLSPEDYAAVANGASLQTRLIADEARRGQPRSGGDFWSMAATRPADAMEALRDAMLAKLGRPQANAHPLSDSLAPWSWEQMLMGAYAVPNGRAPTDIQAMLASDAIPDALSDVGQALAGSVWAQGMDSLNFCRLYPLPDFRVAGIGRASMGPFPAVGEGGVIPEVEFELDGEELQLTHHVAKFLVSLEAVTGDVGVVSALLEQPLQAALRQIRASIFGAIAANPTLADGTAAFHADRGNLITSGSVDISTLDSAFDALASIAVAGDSTLDLEPRFMLCSTANAATARTLLEATGWPVALRPHRALADGTYILLPDPQQAPVVALAVPEGGNPLSVEARGMAKNQDAYVWLHRLDYGVSVVSPYAVMVTA